MRAKDAMLYRLQRYFGATSNRGIDQQQLWRRKIIELRPACWFHQGVALPGNVGNSMRGAVKR
jgi:hypothetical protein